MHYAKFLKYHFGGTKSRLRSILDNMKNEKPAKLAQEIVDKYEAKLNSFNPVNN